MKYKITPVAGKPMVNIRADHSTTSADIGDLLTGHYAEGDILFEFGTDKWLNIATLDGVAKVGWVAVNYAGAAYTVLTENVVTPPTGLPVLHISADGYAPVDMLPL